MNPHKCLELCPLCCKIIDILVSIVAYLVCLGWIVKKWRSKRGLWDTAGCYQRWIFYSHYYSQVGLPSMKGIWLYLITTMLKWSQSYSDKRYVCGVVAHCIFAWVLNFQSYLTMMSSQLPVKLRLIDLVAY